MRKTIFTAILSVFVAGALCSCASSSLSVKSSQHGKISRDAEILILTSQDAYFNNTLYQDSGFLLSGQIESALSEFTENTSIIKNTSSMEKLDETTLSYYDYVFVPCITNWEAKYVNGAIGKPKKLSFTLKLYDKSRNLKDEVLIEKSGSGKTVESILEEYITTLF